MSDSPFYSPGYDREPRDRRLFNDVYLVESRREPCMVCGHPTGDCAGDSGPPVAIAGFGITESLIDEQTFYLEEDIYEERQITPFNKIKVLVHKKGKQIPLREAERLGLWSAPQKLD